MTVRRFPLNTTGRDFAASDLHGEFDEIAEAMARTRFDPEKDRLFLGGDLVDRGRRSTDAIAWLRKPGVYSLLGNHEDQYLTLYANGEPSADALALDTEDSRRQWWRDASADQRAEFLSAWRTLPLAFEIESRIGLIGMVHAGVPQGQDWPSFCRALEAGDATARHSALWSRERYEDRDWDNVAKGTIPGVERVVFGHQASSHVHDFANTLYIDTSLAHGRAAGTSRRGRLTVIDLTLPTDDIVLRRPPQDDFLDLRITPRG